jgi:hypothetical protein
MSARRAFLERLISISIAMPVLTERKNVKAVCAVSRLVQTKPFWSRRKYMTTLPGKAVSPALGLDKQIVLRWLNIALAMLLSATILSCPGPVHVIHCMAGILLLIGCGIHLARHVRWIDAVILKAHNNITPVLHHQKRLFWGMLLSGLICGLSGLVVLPLHVHDPLGSLPLHCCMTPIHALSGLIFTSLSIYHIVLHRNWFGKILAKVPYNP